MIAIQPVLEVEPSDGFTLWPVDGSAPYGFLPLDGTLGPAGVGTAVMSVAACNNAGLDQDRPSRPDDPFGGFLHGLLTMDDLFASGGLRVTDTASGTTLVPGCCNGLEEWRDWYRLLDDRVPLCLGHDPWPLAELVGERVRLTVDTERDDSPVIELTAAQLRALLAGVERDLADFHRLAAAWAGRTLPEHAGPVTAALSRALDLAP